LNKFPELIGNSDLRHEVVLIVFLELILGLGVLVRPSESLAQNRISIGAISVDPRIDAIRANPSAPLYAASNQDASQAAPAYSPSQAKKIELPQGDGKEIAIDYCQDCHLLTNLTKAHKALNEWKETVQTMMDRGARLPQEQVDTLAQYLAKNFGPQTAAPSGDPQAAPTAAAAPADTVSRVRPQSKAAELPEGDGKAIATENCQACHKLTNLTNAHKTLEQWKETVQQMMDRGAIVPEDKVDTLVQYLAKNFSPKVGVSPEASSPSN